MESGAIDLQLGLYAVIAFSVVCAACDLARGRIYNFLTFPMMAAGLVASAWVGGFAGAASALIGVVVGFLIYGWMYAMRAMGGGDVKMLMALGAWGGLHYVTEVAVLGILLGGVMAAGILLAKGRLGSFARGLYRFFLTALIKELEVEAPKIDRKLTMPYGLPIAAAAVWVAVAHPLHGWGIGLWR